MDDKAMVPCSTVSLRTLADGTIRFTVDVEPLNSAVAFKAFSKPGTPCVLAGLTQEVAKKEMIANEAKKAQCVKSTEAIKYHGKHGKWPSNTADAMCKESNFYWYLRSIPLGLGADNDDSYEVRNMGLKRICRIEKKRELDTSPEALNIFMGMLTQYREFAQDNQK